MAHTFAKLTIPNAGTLSNEVPLGSANQVQGFLLGAPVGLAETVAIQVQLSIDGPWYSLTSDGTKLAIATGGECFPLTDVPAVAMRLSSPATAAERIFELSGGWK